MLHVSLDANSLRSDIDQDDQLREILSAGFGDRRFVCTARERSDQLYVSGVVVLRDGSGERLTGDRKAAGIVQQRFDDSDAGQDVEGSFGSMATATAWNGARRVCANWSPERKARFGTTLAD